MNYHIVPIYNGSFTVRLGENPWFDDIVDIPSFCFLLKGETGPPLLVDTGFDTGFIPGLRSHYRRSPQEELPQALHRLGVSPDNIELVVQTHLHWDHTGGMKYFPQAGFVVQKRELQSLYRLPPAEECSYCPQHWLPFLDRFQLLDGTAAVKPGIRVRLAGRHTDGHQVVEVDTRAGKYILGGDAPFNYDDLWKQIPAEYWERYRQGPGRKFFWNSAVRTRLGCFLSQHGWNTDMKAQPLPVKQLTGQLILSHDPGLKKISCLPGIPG